MSTDHSLLHSVVAEAIQTLFDFASGPLFSEKFALAFETPAPSLAAFQSALAQLPEVEVLADEVLQGALGAFSAQTGKIYLSESVVNGDGTQLRAVLLEEIGHYLDSVFNSQDATGDEGAILAALALGNGLSEAELGQLRSKDDLGFIVLDGVEVVIEKATVAEPYLVADINSTSFGSNPSNFINVGGVLYFTANDDVNGTELWRANPATGVVELLDIRPGSNTSSVSNLTDVNGTLYFTANNGTNGTELYRIDSADGAPALIDIWAGGNGSNPSYLTNVNGTLYFQAYDNATGYKLWRIDPTTGTPSVVTVASGSDYSSPYNLVNADGVLYFTAYNNTTGYELWKVDPTTGNAVFLKDIYEGGSSSNPGNLTYSDGKLYFTADNYTQGVELWRTDGTPEGTELVEDINATTLSSSPSNFIEIGGVLYFTANDEINGTELWRANPATGVVALLDIYPGSNASNVSNLTDVNGTLYFTANNGTNGTELYRIDSADGAPALIDIWVGGNWSSPNYLTNVNGTLYFTANNGTNGTELYRIDNATGNPALIDIVSGGSSSSPQDLTAINGILYFSASNSATGRELWKVDPADNLPILVSDIRPGTSSSDPRTFLASGGTIYFIANNGSNGTELYRVDPSTGNITLLDINVGSGSSSPRNLIDVDGTFYFTANDGLGGERFYKIDPTTGNPVQLSVPNLYQDNAAYLDQFTKVGGRLYFRQWANQYLHTIDPTTGNPVIISGVSSVNFLTDVNGTLYFQGYTAANGTELYRIDNSTGNPVLIDVVTGSGWSSPNDFTMVNGVLFFTAQNSANGRELWKLDSNGNPVLVKDIWAGGNSSFPANLFAIGDALYFTANNGVNGVELWVSDGTSEGTVLAKDINERSPSSSPRNLIDVDGTLYFTANDGLGGERFYKIDPTTGNPVQLSVPNLYQDNAAYLDQFTKVGGRLYFRQWANQYLHTIDPTTGNPVIISGVSSVNFLTDVNGTLYFQGYTAANGTELYRIDNSTGNPVLIDVVTGSGWSSPNDFTMVNGVLFFTAQNSANGRELWKLDSNGNPVLVKDIWAGGNSSFPANLFAIGDALYFTANNGVNGVELWVSDGTSEGTVQLEIYAGSSSSNVNNLIDVNGTLYFTADNGTNGAELWRINATTGNPEVIDIRTGSSSSNPSNFVDLNGVLYFTANNGTNGTELYRINNATASPALIDIITGSGSSNPSYLTNVNGTLYFQAYDNATGYKLWRIDPTTGNPSIITVASGSDYASPYNLLNADGALYFTAYNNTTGYELWKVDPTTGNAVFLKDIYEGGGSSNPGNLTYSDGKLYFTADNYTQGVELWRTDGTPEGTELVEDINATTLNSNPSNFIKIGGVLYFTANDEINGTELWRGNPATGVVELLDIYPGSNTSSVSNLTDVNGTLYFTANNGTNGTELYRINNATASPGLIDIITGSGSSSPSYLTNVNGTLYFQAYDNATGYKLWRIDPTTGTPSVVTVASGSDYSSPYNLLDANGVLYFTAYNNTTGYELWKVDPTTGNAVFLKDIYEGGNSSSPGNLTYSNGKLYFTADNGINGVELWAVDVDSVTTIGNVEKTGNEDQVVAFASTDFSSVFTSGSGLPLAQIQIINLPSNGVLKLGDNPVTVNQEIAVADLGGLTFTPAANYNGGAGFTWNGSDGTDYAPNPSTVTLLISAVNDAPTLVNPLADTSIFSNRSSNFGISVNAFQDVDFGDVLTYSATLADGSPLPTWLTFNERTFSGNPTSAQAGQYDVVVTVTDQDGASASDTFVLSVVNSAPTNIALSQNTVTENSANNTVIGQLSASDNNTNDTHTFSLVDDAGGRFAIVGNQLVVANGSLLDYETNTQHTIRVQTTDNTGLSYERNFTVLIANVADELAGVLSFTSSAFSVNENGAAVNAVTIQRENGSEGTVSVNVLLSDGTAVYPNDYNSLAVPVVFGPGEMSKTVTLPIVNDADFEGNETLTVTLSSPTGGATLGSQVTALVTIVDNDLPTISLTVTPPSVTENGGGNLSYVFTRTGNNANPLTVNFTVGGAATFGDDYTVTGAASFAAGAGAVTFAAGASTATLVVAPVADAVFEADETVSLTLTSSADYSLGTPGVITGTILNDDLAAGVLSFSAAEFSVSEDGTPVGAVTLVRSGNLTGSVSVTLNLTNGTATAPSDYNNTPITVNFADGENSKIVTIPIVNDSQFEADETVNLTLSNPQGGAVLGTQTTAVLTILNDDLPQPGTISLNSGAYTVNENGTANITLIRSGGTDGEVSVTLTPADGTATAGSDYNDSPITVTFANGQTSRTVTIPLLDDSQFEPAETVNLILSNPTGGAVLGTQQTAVLTIIDNDAVPGVIQFSNGSYSVNENGTPVTAVTLTRTGGSDGAVSVRVNLANGTATAGSDYNNAPITVNFADGETSKIVTIPIVNDSQFEADETINLSLANVTGGAAIGAQNTALVTIIDDDFQPTLSLTLSNATVAEGNSLQGTVSRNTPTTEPLTVTLFNSDNSQMTVPGTVTIPAGASSATFNLAAVDDTLIEPNRAYNLTASAQGFVSAATSVTVTDNDAVTLSLTLDSPEISENEGKATATVTRNLVTNTPLVVQLSSSDTTEATVPATVTIAANQASATFEIEAVDDAVLDGSQTVAITATPIYTGGTLPLPTGAATANLTVLDNESATLTLTFAQEIISETGTTTATLTRNANIGSALVVTLASSDTSEATVPQTVTIDAGQTSATFTVTGVEDGSNDGSQPVTITASANGFNSDAKTLDVTDINVPDLVMTQLQGSANTYTNQQSQFTYTVSNTGLVTASGQWADRVYLSSDNKLDANDTLLGEFPLGSEENLANLLVGVSYDRAVTYFTPRNPGQYYLIGVTDTGNTVNEGLGIGETNNVTVTPLTVAPAYRASVYTDTDTALMGTAVTLRGQALSNINNAPVPFEFVKVRVENQGNIREFDAFTDANGNFVRQFNPLPGEAGAYNINAYFPGFAQEDSAPEDSFTLVGMRFEQNDQFLTQVSHRITEGTTFNGSVKLQNLSEVALSGLTASVIGAPSDWTVSVTPQKTGLGGNEEITVDYSINVPDDNWRFYNFGLGLNTTQGATATLPIRVDVTQLLPRLVADTSRLEASMLRGGQSVVEFTVTNQGDIPSGPLSLLLPEASWLRSASPATLPSLNPGESTQVSLLLQPSATQDLTVYNGNVVLVGEEASLSLPFNFRAVSEAQGNLNISVVNELFFFAEGSPRLANATITLLDPFTGTVVFSETDADGLLNKTNLAEGYYKLRITADSHDFYEQNIFIGAGETEEVQAFLSRQTVKYSWTVVPTEIQDQYTISIESVFETNVPIPTVVIEPGFIDLDSLQVIGQVMQVDIKVTNHGLIAANDINLNLGTHPFYQIEPLINGVDILAAKSSITIPVRITRIADLNSLAPTGDGFSALSTPQVPCSITGGLDYSYECAGEQIKRAIPLPFLNVEGNCFSGGGGGGGYYWWGGGGGGFGGGGGGGTVSQVTFVSSPSNCDPCDEKNLQASICLGLGLAGCVPNPLSAAVLHT